MVSYTARWTPLGGRWALAVTNEAQKIVSFARTDVRANCEHPGPEHLLDAGFSLFPGGWWRDEPAGWWSPVTPVDGHARDGGRPGH